MLPLGKKYTGKSRGIPSSFEDTADRIVTGIHLKYYQALSRAFGQLLFSGLYLTFLHHGPLFYEFVAATF